MRDTGALHSGCYRVFLKFFAAIGIVSIGAVKRESQWMGRSISRYCLGSLKDGFAAI
jgi:hypothetical protein